MCTSTISISMRVYMWQKNVIVEKTDHSSHASALHHLLSSSIFWCCPNWYRIYRYLPFYIQIPQPLSNREGPYSDCKFLTTKFVCQTSRNWHQHQATKFILDASAPNGTKWTSSGKILYTQTQEFCSIKSCLKLWRPLLSTLGTCVILLLWRAKEGRKTQTWLVVSTHLKNISQNGNLPQIGVKI